MATVEVKRPACGSGNVIEYGKSRNGKQGTTVKTARVSARYSNLKTAITVVNPI